MTETLHLDDRSPMFRGHVRLDIYEGDIRRARLPLRLQAVNLWSRFRYGLPRHLGEVLNPLVQVIEADNLVVTVGKQMIMDRLYGLSAVGAMTRTGVGTSNTAAALGNTSITGGVFKAFTAVAVRTGLVVRSITEFGTAEANIVWAELCLDNGTTILNRIAPIGPFTKTAAVSIAATIDLTQA